MIKISSKLLLVFSLTFILAIESISQCGIPPCNANLSSPCSLPTLAQCGTSQVLFRVPIVVTFVYEDGQCSINPTDLSNWTLGLTRLNNAFYGAGIEFYEFDRKKMCDSDLNSFSYDCHLEATDSEIVLNNNLEFCDGIINIIVVDEVKLGFGPNYFCDNRLCRTITGNAFDGIGNNYLVINRLRLDNPTIVHEMGHVFGLEHTFSVEFGTGTSICEGDGVKDTSFDPGISVCPIPKPATCLFIDEDGNLFHDDYESNGVNISISQWYSIVNNFMSYGVDTKGTMDPTDDRECRSEFTNCQYLKINQVLLNCKGSICGSNNGINNACNIVRSPAPQFMNHDELILNYSICTEKEIAIAENNDLKKLTNCSDNIRWDVNFEGTYQGTETGPELDFNEFLDQVGTYEICLYEVGYNHFPGTSNTCFSELDCFDVEITDCNNTCGLNLDTYMVEYIDTDNDGVEDAAWYWANGVPGTTYEIVHYNSNNLIEQVYSNNPVGTYYYLGPVYNIETGHRICITEENNPDCQISSCSTINFFISPPFPCEDITTFNHTINNTDVTYNWLWNPGSLSIRIEESVDANTINAEYSVIVIDDPNNTITINHNDCENYYVRAQVFCQQGLSQYTDWIYVDMTSNNPSCNTATTCNPVSNLSANENLLDITFNWTIDSDISTVEFCYGISPNNISCYNVGTNTSYTVSNSDLAIYNCVDDLFYYVKSICNDDGINQTSLMTVDVSQRIGCNNGGGCGINEVFIDNDYTCSIGGSLDIQVFASNLPGNFTITTNDETRMVSSPIPAGNSFFVNNLSFDPNISETCVTVVDNSNGCSYTECITNNCSCDVSQAELTILCQAVGGFKVKIAPFGNAYAYNYMDNLGNVSNAFVNDILMPNNGFAYDYPNLPITVDMEWVADPSCQRSFTVTEQMVLDAGCQPPCVVAPYVIPSSLTISCTQDPLDLTVTGQPSTTCPTCAVPTSTITNSNDDCNGTGTVTRDWTYNTECGNTINQTQTITIVDNDPPILVGPDNISISCGENVNDLTLTGNYQSVSDNCSNNLTPTYTDDASLNGCGGTGNITRTWSVTDDCGNTTTDEQIITVQAAAGTFSCPADITILCDGSIDPADTGSPIADVCGGTSSATFVDSGNLSAGGTITRTWSLTDACGTAYNCDQLITMGACISSIDDPCACSDEMNFLMNGVYFFHEVVEVTSSTGKQWDMTSVSSGQVYDASGNILPLPFTGTETPAGSGIYLFDFWHTNGVGFSADYTEVTTLEMLSVGNVCNIPSLDVVCPTANDLGTYNCNTLGNIPACPTDEASAEAAPYGLTIDDMPCGDIVVLCTDDELTNNCVAGNQTITRTVTILDDLNGNGAIDAGELTVDCDFIITIEADVADPIINTEAMDMTVECDGAGNMADLNAWLANNGGAAASDNCGGITFTNNFTILSDDCGSTGSAMVTFTATDDCGNTAATTATFTIEDTTDPMIDTEAMDMTVECDGTGNAAALNAWLLNNGGAVASDECGTITFSNNFTILSNDCGATGSTTVTFTATDDCGLTASTTATFTIEDTTDPVIDIEAMDMTVECDGAGNVNDLNAWLANNGGATASDDCGGVIFTNDFTMLSDDCGATGSAIVTFTATDDCGMTASTTATFTIEDTTDPMIDIEAMNMTVQCDGAGNITELNDWLASNGGATASDDCGGVTFTNNFTMLSDDCGATGSATVTFTATDECGMTANTTATFTIEDTMGPVITCPTNQMLICNTDPLPFATTISDFQAIGGTAMDDCSMLSELTISFIDSPINQAMLNFCADDPAERTLTRTYTITDICGNSSTCEQQFIYEQITTGPMITSVPPDQTVDCAVNAIPQSHLLEFTTECAIGTTVSISQPDGNGTTGCNGSTIQYEYTVTDVCGRSAVAVQTYTIANEGPEFVCPPDICVIECPADTDMIQAQFDSYAGLATVITSCSEASISIGNNFNPNGFIPQNCLNPTVAVEGAVAYQIVTFTASDACGRNATCTALVVIKDSDGPVITGNVSFGLADCNDTDLQAGYTNWATNQLNGLSATDECINGAVTFSYSPLTPNVDCSSGLASTLVSFTATDDCGNSSIQTAYYRIIDNGTGEPVMATVSGNLFTEESEMVALANVEVEGGSNNYMMTNSDGYYHFDLEMAQNYAVLPSRNDDPLNGITTYDLVLLGQHLLEFNLLDSPYKMIAADVNESGSITSLDLIQLRRLILHIDDQFPSGKSWTFVDASFVFPQPMNPFATTFPTSYSINNLTSPEIVDFIGVKLGDLNGSASPNLLQVGDTRSSNGQLPIRLEDQFLKAGQEYNLDFKASDFKDVDGFQFTLDFDPTYLSDLDFEESELTNMSANNFGFTKTRDGKLTVSWNANQPVIMPDDATLFKISITALKTTQLSQIIKLSSSLTANEAYQKNLLKEVVLDFETVNISERKFVLLQNQPNPFAQETVIGFQLPEATDATLTIFDVSGRAVWSQTENYSVGVHQITVEKDRLKGSGVYYYQLSTGTDTAIRKMIVLK